MHATDRHSETTVWLQRYSEPRRITGGQTFSAYRCSGTDGRPRVLVTAQGQSDGAAAVLDDVAEVHERGAGAHVPELEERGRCGEIEYVALRCDAVSTIGDMFDWWDSVAPAPIPYESSLGYAVALFDTLPRLHALRSARTGRSFCSGVACAYNVLLQADGTPQFVGIGTPLVLTGRLGDRTAAPRTVRAPEVSMGGAATPASDILAHIQLNRSFHPYLDVPNPLARVLRGEITEDDHWLMESIEQSERCFQSYNPASRPESFDEVIAHYLERWKRLGIAPSLPKFREAVAPLISRFSREGSHPVGTPSSAPGQEWWAGRYRLDGVLGRGATSTVYRARDLELGEWVAVKLLHEQAEPGLVDRLRREVRLLRRIQHGSLVRSFDFVCHKGRCAAVTELIEGDNLAQAAARQDAPRLALVANLAGVAQALAALHEAGVVHRDVKPANIVMHPQRGPVLVDLGIARELGAETRLTALGGQLGTPRYMSPEQYAGADVEARSDVFSLALVALELLCDEDAFRLIEEGTGDPSGAPGALPAELPERLRQTLTRALSVEPHARPTAGELAGALS